MFVKGMVMKRLLFLIMVSVFQLNQSMETVQINPQQRWRDHFYKQLPKQKYNDIVDYDLNLCLWKDDRENVVHKNLSLLAHGFGASPTTMAEYARLEGPHCIPGDKVTFNFKDAFNGELSFITHSSFGQIEDIKSLLVAIKAMHDCCWVKDSIGCNIFSHSRGAGAVANTLAVLNTKVDEWSSDFDGIKLFFTEKHREQMLLMIKKGVVILDAPMVTAQIGVRSLMHSILGGWLGQNIADFIHDCILPAITDGNYSPSGVQALTSVQGMPKDVKLLVSFQWGDEFVSNAYDREFSERLSSHLHEGNLWVVLGNHKGKEFDDETWQLLEIADQEEKLQKRWIVGGLPYRSFLAHGAGFASLLQSGVLNAFFKKHECSYNEGHGTLNDALKILEKAHCVKNFEEHFKNYDMNNDASGTDHSI
jgi:hypothetical protein